MTNYIKLFFLGSLTFLLFPPYFLLPIGFITLPYFYFIVTKDINKTLKKSFLEGYVFGFGLNFFLFYWLKNPFLIDESTKDYFLISYLIVFFISIYFGFFTLFLRFFKNKIIQIIIFPALFVLFEIIRTKLFLPFPWNLFGTIVSDKNYLSQIINIIGTYGLSYFVILLLILPVSVYNIINNINLKFNSYYIIFILSIFLLLFFFINFQHESKKSIERNIDFILYQNNTKQIDKWNIDKMNIRFNELINFIDENKENENKTVIIFSETEIPYIISRDAVLLNFIKEKLDQNTIILIGGIRKDNNNNFYNSLFKIDNNNIEFFDKKILVPFGEYIPLKNILKFINKITQGSNNFTKGTGERNLKIFDNFIIPTICYENIFFENLLNKNNLNNELIINITNDAWFGKNQGPYQHYYNSILRAQEFKKYLIRVSNNGISSIINPNGKILVSSKLNEKKIIYYSLIFKEEKTELFFKNKNLLIYFYLFLIIFISIFLERKKFE